MRRLQPITSIVDQITTLHNDEERVNCFTSGESLMCALGLDLTHTHTHIYIYIYVYEIESKRTHRDSPEVKQLTFSSSLHRVVI